MDLFTCQGVAMDSDLFNADKSIDDNNVPHQFVFNLDECGNQDWVDAREVRNIVPKSL